MKRIALITGATSGFGEAIATRLAKEGYDLIITGRRSEKLIQLKDQLQSEYTVAVLTLCFDVRNKEAVYAAISSISGNWTKIDILINNAGLARGFDKIQEGKMNDWEEMIDTNIKGLLYVSDAIIPGMVERGSGHIINIGSTAGKEVYERGNVYCASKHAVDALSKAMRIDLLGTGIKVTQIAPGAAETEFSEVRFHGDKQKAQQVYNGYQPMKAEDIADILFYVVNLPPNLCINDLVVTSLAQANSFYINRKP